MHLVVRLKYIGATSEKKHHFKHNASFCYVSFLHVVYFSSFSRGLPVLVLFKAFPTPHGLVSNELIFKECRFELSALENVLFSYVTINMNAKKCQVGNNNFLFKSVSGSMAWVQGMGMCIRKLFHNL